MTVAQSEEINGLIQRLEALRGSKAIVYFTGSKPPPQQFATVVALDVIPLFKKILDGQKKTKKITLVLDTNGGNLSAPWPLVNLLREYCKTLEVLVLEKALSAGTMIALGADKIVMLPHSQLSPIDPAANVVDGQSKQQRRFEVEDIIGFTTFAKEKLGISSSTDLVEVLKELTKEVPPTMLGSINRTHSLIRKLAKSLLELHQVKLREEDNEKVVKNLTQELYSHSHLINRREAKNDIGLGSIIEYATKPVMIASEKINEYLVKLMEIDTMFNPSEILGDEVSKEYSLVRAVVYSTNQKFEFKTNYQLGKIPGPSGNQQFVVNPIKEGWEERS